MARVLTHHFRGGDRSYVEGKDEAMVRRIAEVLARNLDEVDDPEVVEQIIDSFDHASTIETAEAAIALYCEAVPHEGFSLTLAYRTTVRIEDEAPPLAESVAAMRRHLQRLGG